MGTSNSKERIIELLSGKKKAFRAGKFAFSSLAILILISGWINLRLTTDVTMAVTVVVSRAAGTDELDNRIGDLVAQLSSSDEVSKKFRKIATSDAGKIAIGNEIAEMADAMRGEAANAAVPEFFEHQVDEQFRESVAAEVIQAKSDIDAIENLLSQLRGQINGDTDADKLFSRFIANENSALVFYFAELREQMQPGGNEVMERLGRVLAPDGNGKYVVRDSAKASLIQRLKRFDGAGKHLKFLKDELRLIGDEIIEKDELHKKLKSRLLKSQGAVLVLAIAMEGDETLDRRVEKYLDSLEYFFEDAPDGLIINEDAREQLQNGMQQMDGLIKKMKVLRSPITEIVEAIDETRSDSEKSIKEFLKSEVGVAFLSASLNVETNDIDSVEDNIKSELLQVADEGGFAVREDRIEEVSEFSKELLSGNRRLRRQLRMVDNRTSDVPTEKLGELANSPVAKLILIEKVQLYLKSQSFDAWPNFMEDNFEMRDGKYVVREEAKEMIDHLIDESAAIQEQLANDDF